MQIRVEGVGEAQRKLRQMANAGPGITRVALFEGAHIIRDAARGQLGGVAGYRAVEGSLVWIGEESIKSDIAASISVERG